MTLPYEETDPFRVLGVTEHATEQEVRERYLTLVKKYPPESEPEKFREIHAAFQAVKDPLVIARRLLMQPAETTPAWQSVIDREKSHPPNLSVKLLLSLGNREKSNNEL